MNLGRPARARRPFQSHCLAWLAPNCFASSNRPLSSRRLTTVPNVASLLAQQHFRSSSQTNVSEGDTVRVNGFVRTVRKQKRVAFASISDGSCLDAVQVVLSPEHAEGLVQRPPFYLWHCLLTLRGGSSVFPQESGFP